MPSAEYEIDRPFSSLPVITAAGLALFVSLIVSQVSIGIVLLILVIVGFQTFSGAVAVFWFTNRQSMPLARLLGLGFAIGSALSVVCDQMLRTTNIRGIGWTLPSLIAVIYLVTSRNRTTTTGQRLVSQNSDYSFIRVFSFLYLVPFVTLNQFWPWTRMMSLGLVIVVLVVLFRHYSSTGLQSRDTFFIFAVMTVVTVIALISRPDYWWLPGWGIDEHDLFAHAVFQWGIMGDALSAGISVGYQWFGYAWMGLVSNFSQASDFVFVSRASYVISAIAIICLFFSIAEHITRSQRQAIIATLIGTLISTSISYPMNYTLIPINYQAYAIVLILAWLHIFQLWFSNPSPRMSLLLAIVGTAAVAAKSAHIVPLGVGLSSVAVFEFMRQRNYARLVGIATSLASLMIYTVFFFPSAGGTGLSRATMSYTKNFGVSLESNGIVRWVFYAACIMVGLTSLSIMGAASMFLRNTQRHLSVFLLSGLLVGIVFANTFERVSSTELHFVQIPVLMSIPIVVAWLIHELANPTTRNTVRGTSSMIPLIASSIAMPLGLVIMQSRDSNGYGFRDEDLSRASNMVAAIFVGLLALYILLWSCRRPTYRKPFRIHTVLAFLCLTLFSVSTFVTLAIIGPLRPINEIAAIEQLGQPPLREVSDWIRQNTDVNDIFASNSFFGEQVDDRCTSSPTEIANVVMSEVKQTNYFTTAVLIKRRLIAAGVKYGFMGSTEDPTQRIQLSLLFACHPDNDSLVGLQKFGVSWYLAYRNQIDLSTWQGFGGLKFANEHYSLTFARAGNADHQVVASE